MSDDPDNSGGHGRFASPPCYAGEIAPDYFDPLAVDPEQARDVARWRKAERTRLRAGRMELPVATRKAAGEALAGHLRQLLLNQFDGARGMILSAYWPIKGEPDLRSLMGELHEAGVVIAFSQPLRIGDTVLIEGNWGKVEDISLTYSIIRIWDWVYQLQLRHMDF